MTIEPRQDCFVVHCDTCPEYFIDETLEFDELIKMIKLKGWKLYKDENDKWSHKCPACQEFPE